MNRAGPIAAAIFLMASASASAAAPGQRDPDWPCMQVKVSQLSLAAVWSGPPVDAYETTWSHDPATANLVARLVRRRVALEQVETEVAGFVVSAGSGKQDKLLALMAGLFSTLNAERSNVLSGLDRFGRRQKELADKIRTEASALREHQAAGTPDQQQIADLTQRLAWDTRLFEDRRQSVSAACDVPNVIEQRLFSLAKTVQDAL